jgi:ribonuclease P protein component
VGIRNKESFPAKLRLTRAAQYRQIFKNNKRVGDASITILVGNSTGSVPRLGFAIAKKQIAKAVLRNRLKRIIRESFRKNQHRLPARDMVIMVRRSIMLIDKAQLNSNLEKHWKSVIEQCENS